MTYSVDDLRRMRAAAVIIIGTRGDSALERFELIEDLVRESVRAGIPVTKLERTADGIARVEGKRLLREMSVGRAAKWQDPGYIAWVEKRGLTYEEDRQ